MEILAKIEPGMWVSYREQEFEEINGPPYLGRVIRKDDQSVWVNPVCGGALWVEEEEEVTASRLIAICSPEQTAHIPERRGTL